jgi:putative endonuclease
LERHCEEPKSFWWKQSFESADYRNYEQKEMNRSNLKIVERGGYIYILTNKNNTVLYTGVTSNLPNRMYEHQTGLYKNSFTSKYNVKRLVYYEGFTSIEEAIAREKQLKAGSRQKKLDLINHFNPDWKDLSEVIE